MLFLVSCISLALARNSTKMHIENDNSCGFSSWVFDSIYY